MEEAIKTLNEKVQHLENWKFKIVVFGAVALALATFFGISGAGLRTEVNSLTESKATLAGEVETLKKRIDGLNSELEEKFKDFYQAKVDSFARDAGVESIKNIFIMSNYGSFKGYAPEFTDGNNQRFFTILIPTLQTDTNYKVNLGNVVGRERKPNTDPYVLGAEVLLKSRNYFVVRLESKTAEPLEIEFDWNIDT